MYRHARSNSVARDRSAVRREVRASRLGTNETVRFFLFILFILSWVDPRAREHSSTITTRDDETERERGDEKDVIDRRARFEKDAKRLRRAGVTKSVRAPNARRSSARRFARGARDQRRRSAAPGARGEPIVDA
jgi:hypothetical protein